MSQPTLFDTRTTAGTHRAGDPDTSVAAARSVNAAPMADRVLGVLRHRGSQGATAWEVMSYLSAMGVTVAQNSVARRLDDLERDGLAVRTDERRPGSSIRLLIVWQVIPTRKEL